MGGTTDRNDDIEMGASQGMWDTSAASDTSSNDPKRKKEKKAVDDDDLEPNYQPVNWKKVFFTPKYIPLWIVMIIIGVITAVITLKHDQVVAALRPFAEKVRDITAGWLIFIAILFIISFPPLFGHELVALLAGVVYGLWIGFAVVAAGTFIGESEYPSHENLTVQRCDLNGVLIRIHSWNMVRLQEAIPEEGRENGEDEPHLRRNGQIMS